MATIFKKFDKSKTAYINPTDTTKPVEGFPEICISTFSENIINTFSTKKDVTIITHLYSANGILPIYKIHHKGKDIAFYLSRVGAPACVAGFEEIIAMGAKKIVIFGCCGVLDSTATDGKIIVPTSAVRDEGTSYHYQPASDEIEASSESINLLTACLEKYNHPYIKGKVWTTDAIYRETQTTIAARKAEGCLAVEMEYAAMLAVAKFRNIPYIQFLYSADQLDTETWNPRDLTDYGQTNAEKYMTLALECGITL